MWPLCACVCRLLPGSTRAVAFRAQTSFVYMTRVGAYPWAVASPVNTYGGLAFTLLCCHCSTLAAAYTHKQHAALQCLSAANRARPSLVCVGSSSEPCTMRPFDTRLRVLRAGFWPVLVVGQVP